MWRGIDHLVPLCRSDCRLESDSSLPGRGKLGVMHTSHVMVGDLFFFRRGEEEKEEAFKRRRKKKKKKKKKFEAAVAVN